MNIKIFANKDKLDKQTINQINDISNIVYNNEHIRIMPDCHYGKGCVVGYTTTFTNKISPNTVGVDIGCGMLIVKLGKIKINFDKLNNIIKEYIPTGFSIRQNINLNKKEESLWKQILQLPYIKNLSRIKNSFGTLGGGNHFIEIDEDDEGCKYLIIHTGSRNFGAQVAKHYQDIAYKELIQLSKFQYKQKIDNKIKELKQKGLQNEISKTIKKMKENNNKVNNKINKDLAYLTFSNDSFFDYLNDVCLCQLYANYNRIRIASTILQKFNKTNIEEMEFFQTIHNYIDSYDNIIRKGAISAKKNEKVLIPLNMRDGSLICIGKGNQDYNFSAPHGAGRLMSRTEAKNKLNLKDVKKDLDNVYTKTLNENTIDEAAAAYKNINDILPYIKDTVKVIKHIKPIFNYKG